MVRVEAHHNLAWKQLLISLLNIIVIIVIYWFAFIENLSNENDKNRIFAIFKTIAK